MTNFRRFYLQRDEDVSGYSGTGRVADGVQYNDGVIALRWNGNTPTTTIYNNIKEMDYLHSHDGRTKIVWVDPIIDVIDV